MNKWFQNVKRLLEPKETDSGKRPTKLTYFIVIGLIGLFILLVSNVFSSPNEHRTIMEQPVEREEVTETSNTSKNETEINKEVEVTYEKDIADMIEKIQGVTNVDVMVNIDSSDVTIYKENRTTGKQTTDETDTNGGQRKVEDATEETEVVLVRQGDQEIPLIVQTKKPTVRGVFIVANGVEDPTIKLWVIESVAKVLDVPPHKISVMPK